MTIPSNTVPKQVELEAYMSAGRRHASPLRDALFSAARRLRHNEALLWLALQAFRTLQRMGVSVVPNHYYWPVPDINSLAAQHWLDDRVPAGMDFSLDRQVVFLWDTARPYLEECNFADAEDGTGRYHYNNGFYETVDAEMAYSVVRSEKPARIIEVGGGYSSRVLATALESNQHETGQKGELITIDPFLERGAANFYDNALVLQKSIQEVKLELFESLGEGDILFLDSSHVVAIGSDVVREYLEILPRLRRGVLVHVHDIFLPRDYPREFIYRNLCFWSEQYLLQAFLTFNPQYELLWGSSAMALSHRELLDEALPRWKTTCRRMPREKGQFVPALDTQRVWPSSLWMRRR